MRVTLIGANGFVGSAFVRLLQTRPDVELVCVTRDNFGTIPSAWSDVVIEAACNSKKFIADQNPAADFEASVTHRLKSLLKFPAGLHLHISSVDVYSDLTTPETTREDSAIDPKQASRYGFHKLLAEELVRHYAPNWLILRLAGMVGPGLRKNPVFDILNGQPLRISSDSQFQYLSTDAVAQIGWGLVERKARGEIFNVCGDGTIAIKEIAGLAGLPLDLTAVPSDAKPRIVDANIEKIRNVFPMPKTKDIIRSFISGAVKKNNP